MTTTRIALLTAIAGVAAATAIAPSASAATQRHADPTGAGTACTSPSPCSVREAIEGAGDGDEVIVAPGDYPLTATVWAPYGITIHGVAGQPRPRLLFSGGQLRLSDSTLRYVQIEQTAAQAALFAGTWSVIDQVVAKGSAPGVMTANIQSSTIRNSVVVATGSGGQAIVTDTNGATNTSAYRNVTAVATSAGGIAIRANALGAAGNVTINATNVIAYAPAGTGLEASTDDSGAHATINAAHSNFATGSTAGSNAAITSGGGNQETPPAFVDAAGGDYRQAIGSATIGAGLDDPANGELDVDGDPRKIGTTDIGADEFVPAPSAPSGPSGAGATSGTPSRGVDAGGAPTAPAAPAAAAPQLAGVELLSSKLTYARGRIALTLRCPAAGGCAGTVKLAAKSRRTGSRVVLGRAGVSIAAGEQAKVRVRVSRSGRRLLRGSRSLRARAIVAVSDGAGDAKTTRATVTIRRKRG